MSGKENAIVVIRDITEMMKMQAMMIQTEKTISVGGIAAGIAHEINNPLRIILQASQNMVHRCDSEFAKNRTVEEKIGIDIRFIDKYMHERKINVFL